MQNEAFNSINRSQDAASSMLFQNHNLLGGQLAERALHVSDHFIEQLCSCYTDQVKLAEPIITDAEKRVNQKEKSIS